KTARPFPARRVAETRMRLALSAPQKCLARLAPRAPKLLRTMRALKRLPASQAHLALRALPPLREPPARPPPRRPGAKAAPNPPQPRDATAARGRPALLWAIRSGWTWRSSIT